MKIFALCLLLVASAGAQINNGGGGSGSMTWPSTPGIPVCTGTPCTAWGTTLADPVAVAHGGSGTASTLTGIVRGGNPFAASELSGDCATSGSNLVTCTKLNGNSFPSGVALGDLFYGSATTAISKLSGPTATNSVPQFLQETPAAGVATAPVWSPAGVPTNAQTGTTYTVAATDRASYVTFSNAGSIAVTLPQAGTTGFASNLPFIGCDIGVGTATITPTTSTISYTTGTAYTSAAATMTLATGECAWIYSDNANYFAVKRSGNASNSFPLTVAGTVTSGGIPCFTSTTQESSSALFTTNVLLKGGGAGACPVNSLATDDGTTSTYTGTGGTKSPVFTATGTTAGFHDYPQGTTSSAVAPCNVATSICEQAPAAVTSYLVTKPGAAGTGTRISVNSASSITENFSSAFGAVTQSAKTAAVTTFTVCSATANTACGQAGQYRLTYNVWGSGTACATVTAGSVVLNFTWTDENAVTHTTINAPMWDQKTAAMTAGQTNFNTALGTEGGSGSFIVSTNGTIIQAATTYTACTSGTGTYNVRITTEQLQ